MCKKSFTSTCERRESIAYRKRRTAHGKENSDHGKEPLYAAMMFAVNIAATDNVFDALSRKFYLSPNSGSYRINILHTSWIRYEPYDSYYLQASNRIKTDDRQLFYLCMSYEIIWRFLNHIWEQYLEMLNRNITYADMSKNLVYPSYMVVETAEEDWYIVEL